MIQSIQPGRNGTHPDPEPLKYISASTVKLYLSCPLKYWFRKVLKIPEPVSPAFHLGKSVHSGLQHFHKARWRGESHDKEAVLKAFSEAFNDPAEAAEYNTEEDRQKNHEKGLRVVEAYLDSDHARMEETPLGVEVQLEEDLPGLPCPVLGYIDLVRQNSVPVDYKTCASTPNLELESFQHELQLTLYQMLIESATGERVEGRELVFLTKTKVPRVVVHRLMPATEREKQRALDMCSAALEGIKAERYHPVPGMQCSFCAYRAKCAQWTKGGVA